MISIDEASRTVVIETSDKSVIEVVAPGPQGPQGPVGPQGTQDTFSAISVAGQANIIADSPSDLLNIAAGSGITITTDAASDTITISAVGGAGSGDVVGPSIATDNAIARFDLTTGKLIQNSLATLSDTGDLNTVGATLGYLQIDTTATPAAATGRASWDDGNGTLAVGLKGGNVVLYAGEQQYTRVFNDTASTITKGQVVYISGAQGNRVAVRLARADNELTSKDTIGLIAESIAAGAEGWAIHSGSLYDINTAGLVAGDTVYLSSTTAGGYTTTKPSAPNHTVILGFVQRVHTSAGSFYIKIDNGYEIDELHNVSASAATNGNTLIYDASTSLWKAANLTEGHGISITEGAGTITVSVSDGDKGDITVSGSGANWNVDNDAITYAKIQNVSTTDRLLGRSSAGAGDIEEIACTAAGRALLDDVDASAQRATLGLGTLATQSGTFSGSSSGTNTGDQSLFSTIAVSGQSSVVADSTSDTLTLVAGSNVTITTDASTDSITISSTGVGDGDKGDITVSGTGTVWAIDNDVVTYAKMQNVSATDRLLGRSTAGAGDVEEIVCTSAGRALLDDIDASAQRNTLGLGTLATQNGTFSGASSGTNTGDQNLFSTIAVAGQSNVVADSTSDTLTLVAGSNVTITTDALTDTITISSTGGGGGSLTDGDKGDITVSGSGTAWTIDNDAVTYAKIQNVSATDRILGRSTAGAGDIEEITCTSAGRALLDDVDASAQRITLGLGTLATQSGTFSGTSSGTNTGDQNLFSTIAVAGQSSVVADTTTDTLTLVAGSNVTITTDASTDTITISSTGGGGGGVSDGDKGDITVSGAGSTWTIDNDTVTYAKIQNVTSSRLLGRASAGNGDTEEIQLGSNLAFSGTSLQVINLQKTITSGTAAPTGGADGDIYLQYNA